MAFKLSTLHIFGYGEAQIIGKDGETSINKKVPTASLTKLAPVVADIYSHKPAGSVATEEFHAINAFEGMFADWQPKGKDVDGWRVKWADLNTAAIDALVSEIVALPVESVAQPSGSAKK